MRFIVLLLAFCFVPLLNDSRAQWTVISTQGNEAISFPSNSTGYSTSNGITKKSTNGGYNWSSLSGGNLTGIFFINNTTGWVVGYPGYIGKTTNGSSFTQQPTGISDRLNDVYFINENTGWVVGGDFSVERIFKTTNGGANWTAQTSGSANKLFSVYFINENTGWAVGGPSSPKIIKTTNGGANWFNQSTTGISTPLYSVMFANENTGWAVAGYIGGETIVKTTNGGTNWFSQTSGDTRYLRDCYVIDSLRAVSVGQGGKIITTTNGGANWNVMQTGSTVELWSVDFPSDSVGYTIGSNAVLKTTNGGLTFAEEHSKNIPEDYRLYQNYPNPFNPKTTISFQIPVANHITLIVYDLSGRKISVPVNKSLKAGIYEFIFDGSQLASGIYFYKITAGTFTDSGNMILLK